MATEIAQVATALAVQADVNIPNVNKLVFVGGSSMMSVVERAMRAAFPQAEVHRGAAMTAIVDGLVLASPHAFSSARG